jgi:hypothetical protein
MRVFLTSPWIPAEWIRAHGHEAHGLWRHFRHDAPPLAAGRCAFAESAARFAETQPEAAIIFTTGCDQLRRACDAATARGASRSFLFNLPATWTPTAKQIYRAEMERLGKFLVQQGGSAPTPEMLRRQMLQADEIRRNLREAADKAQPKGVPLALVGGPLGACHQNLLDTLEHAGGCVVVNAAENGERSLAPCLELDAAGDPFDALINGYFENIVDVFQRPNTPLYSWLKARLTSRRVRGIVLWLFTGCDLWRAEAQSLRETFGLPVLPLEADEAAGISPRDVNRLQAFVETLK